MFSENEEKRNHHREFQLQSVNSHYERLTNERKTID